MVSLSRSRLLRILDNQPVASLQSAAVRTRCALVMHLGEGRSGRACSLAFFIACGLRRPREDAAKHVCTCVHPTMSAVSSSSTI